MLHTVFARVAESEVKYPTPTPTFPKSPTPTRLRFLNIKNEVCFSKNFVAIGNQWKSWCTARNLFQKFVKDCTISKEIPNLVMQK